MFGKSNYAVLGATGNCGQALLDVLLQSPQNTVKAYCRSRDKLVRLQPGIEQNSQIQVYEGSVSDTDLLAECLSQTHAAFLTVATTKNIPACSIAQDTAFAVVMALEKLAKQNQRLPKLIVLSSASTDHRLMGSVPTFARNMLYRAFSYIYDDLKAAETYLRSKEHLVTATFARPGALAYDLQRGHVLSTKEAVSPVSFLDLAAGMIEIAKAHGDLYDMKGVAVNPTSNDVAIPWGSSMLILEGLLYHFFPWTYGLIAG